MLAQKDNQMVNQKVEQGSPRQVHSRNLLIGMAIFAAVVAIGFFILGVIQHFWPLYLVSAAFVISVIADVFTLTSFLDAPIAIKMVFATLAIEIALALLGGILSFAYGLPIALLAIVVAFMFAAYNPTGWLNEWIIGVGLVGALVSAVLGVLTPIPQIVNSNINILIGVIDLAAIILLIRVLISGVFIASLRLKLILSALALAILPLLILAAINLSSIRSVVTAQSNQNLKIATELSVEQVDEFFSSELTSLQNEASLPVIQTYLTMDPLTRQNTVEEQNLSTTINSLQAKDTQYAPSYGLLNTLGIDVFDTNTKSVGKSEFYNDYFQTVYSTHAAYVSPVEFIRDTRDSYIYFITPVTTTTQTIIGYLRMTIDSHVLQSVLEKSAGMIGTHSYPILIDENGIRLADTSNPDLLYHSIQTIDADKYNSLLVAGRVPDYITQSQIASPINEIADALFTIKLNPYQFFSVNLQNSQNGSTDTATYGVMTTQKWYVVYLQEQTSLLSSQQQLTQSTAFVAVLIVSLVSLIIAIASTLFTRPITDLTDIAKLIADGNLDVHVNVNSKDEIGDLGDTFNSMASQLKDSFETMDRRVSDRTLELNRQNDALRYRSRQLQTVTDVARSIVSSNDMESLLNLVTQLISDRFNFYHAGVFLLDESGEYAVLRASNSPGGRRMLNRQHKLRVGQVGIVGNVTGTGQPRIATDVGKDAVFFNNPDLPETKSEMALPLKIENQVIGALDIQSIESNAFSEEDINLFTTLADQISVAINNNRLLEDAQRALDEAQNLHRQYLNQEWSKRSIDSGRSSYKYTSGKGLSPYEEDLPEVKMVFESGRPVTRSAVKDNENDKTFSTLAVPILLRGEVIGVIHLQENESSSFVWSEGELITVQTLADQLAQTLESARLFEQTIRRADRERRVLEITSKIRSTNDPQQMLEITLEELKQHLGASQAQIVINLPAQTLPADETAMKRNNGNKEA
jgi:GAF domain-containing protein/HAMP domain-containing protein